MQLANAELQWPPRGARCNLHVLCWSGYKGKHNTIIPFVMDRNVLGRGLSKDTIRGPLHGALFTRQTVTRYAFARYALTRYACARYAFTRYVFTRYAFTRYACARCAFTRYAFTRYACARYAFTSCAVVAWIPTPMRDGAQLSRLLDA
jgi:hypothetical protein